MYDEKENAAQHRGIIFWLVCVCAIAALIGFSWHYIHDSSNDSNTHSDLLANHNTPLNIEAPPTHNNNESILYLEASTPQDTMPNPTPPAPNILENNPTLDTKPLNTHAKSNTPPNTTHTKKPKVAIIIDDLANKRDILRFDSLNLNLSLSLFPKQNFSKNNPDVARKLEFYMIHLPLEAHNFEQQGVFTLHRGDSLHTIESHIAQIKRDFPNLSYLNNHTGSAYTESMEDMERLLSVLHKYGITFVDSRTTPKSAAKAILLNQGRTYLARHVFLDNEADFSAIAKQLEIALSIARKQGYVIAIGHPKEPTYQVLKQYQHILLRDYDMVYVRDLEAFLRTNNILDGTKPLYSRNAGKIHAAQ